MKTRIPLLRTPQVFASFALLPILVAVMAVAGLLLMAQPASAVNNGPTQTGEICMQKVFGTPVTNANKLNCTANDIRLSRAITVSPSTCTEGTHFNLTATFETIVTANSRYDAGFFFRTDGGTTARGDGSGATGTCSLSALTPGVSPALSAGAPGADADTCGDLNSGTYNLTFTILDVLCHDSDGDGFLNLPNCTSWHSNQGTACTITNAFDFDPDTKSKCVCDDTFQVPVIVETATLQVTKDVSPGTVPETGGTVTYTVKVKNTASFVSVDITSLIDDQYGDLLDTGNTSVSDNTCPTVFTGAGLGATLSPGEEQTCTFKGVVPPGDTGGEFTDTVEACGTDTANHDVCGHDDATVTYTDVGSTPTVDKTAKSAANCQLDVNYLVVVSNHSAIDTLTVNSLTDDKFGDITTVHAAGSGVEQVVSTTCTLPQPAIAVLDNFTCSFVGRIASSVCTFTHTDTVTGNVTDDDNVTSTPSDSASVTVTTTFP